MKKINLRPDPVIHNTRNFPIPLFSFFLSIKKIATGKTTSGRYGRIKTSGSSDGHFVRVKSSPLALGINKRPRLEGRGLGPPDGLAHFLPDK